MSTSSFLDVANIVLRELNEVPLTSTSFANAVGIQQFVKDCVIKALFDINTKYHKWPFLAPTISQDPHLGNVVLDITAGNRWHKLKPTAIDIEDQYGFIDWDNFMVTSEGVVGETAPYDMVQLSPISMEDYSEHFAEREALSETEGAGFAIPRRVIRHPRGTYFGLSPLPDKNYKVYFYAWDRLTKPTVAASIFAFEEQWIYTVLVPRTRYYAWMFKENPAQAQMAEAEWKKGIRNMKEQLIDDKAKVYFKDDRIIAV